MHRLIDKLFRHESISGDGLCPTYLHRWTLLKLPGARVYLHKFVGDDWSKDPHDHPKDFISIGLRGRYWETSYDTDKPRDTSWAAPWIRWFPARHTHRIELYSDRKPCWTLCIVGWRKREWGFLLHGEQWIPWDRYVHGPGVNRKSC